LWGFEFNHGHVENTQHHILGRPDDRLTSAGFEQVLGGQPRRRAPERPYQTGVHEQPSVPVEVCIKSGANQRVELDGRAFDQGRFKSLDAQTMKGGSAVQQNRTIFDDLPQASYTSGRVALDKARPLDIAA